MVNAGPFEDVQGSIFLCVASVCSGHLESWNEQRSLRHMPADQVKKALTGQCLVLAGIHTVPFFSLILRIPLC